jgi:hypothetical protein
MTKTCYNPKCRAELPATSENFYACRAKKDGFDGYCKPCRTARNAESNARHFVKGSTYNSWKEMKARCGNRHGRSPAYELVFYSPLWETYPGFVASLGERPPGTQLGRKHDMGNYEPGNAWWMTHEEQVEHARIKRSMKAEGLID